MSLGGRLSRWPVAGAPLLVCLGAGLFRLLGLPAPWLTGSALAAAVLSMSGIAVAIPRPLQQTGLLLLGVTLGAGVGPEVLTGFEHWPISLLALLATVPLIVCTAQAALVWGFGWEPREAFLAAVPGALSYVIAIASAEQLDVRKIAIAQSLRLLAIVMLVPLYFGSLARSTGMPVGPSVQVLPLLALCAVSLATSHGLARIGTPAAPLMAGLIVSILSHATGIVTTGVPEALQIAAIVIIGAGVGARFAGSRWSELGAMLAPSVVSLVLAVAASTLVAIGLAELLHLPTMQMLLAFMPGGVDSIAVLVLTLKLDAAFVTAHQMLRFLAIAAFLPAVFRVFAARQPAA